MRKTLIDIATDSSSKLEQKYDRITNESALADILSPPFVVVLMPSIAQLLVDGYGYQYEDAVNAAYAISSRTEKLLPTGDRCTAKQIAAISTQSVVILRSELIALVARSVDDRQAANYYNGLASLQRTGLQVA